MAVGVEEASREDQPELSKAQSHSFQSGEVEILCEPSGREEALELNSSSPLV